MHDLFNEIILAFDPIENQKLLARCLLLSVPNIGDEIIEDIKKHFDHGKYQVVGDFELFTTEPITLHCEWIADFEYSQPDPPIDERESKYDQIAKLQFINLDLRGYVAGDEVDLNINMDRLHEYVHKNLTEN